MNKEKLKGMLTPDFLKTLKVASECYGWSGDLIELINFHRWCHNVAGTSAPTIDIDFEMDGDI
jgi:hypothetical protein